MRLAFYAVGFVLFVAAVAMVAQRHGGDGAGSTIAQGAANMAPKVSLGGKQRREAGRLKLSKG